MKEKLVNSKYLRYILGFFVFGMILCGFYLENSVLLFVISIFLIIAAIREYRNMYEQKEIYIHKFLPEGIGILFALIFCFPISEYSHNYITPITVIGIIMTFILTIIRNKKPYILTSIATILSFLLVFCGLYVIKITYQYSYNEHWYILLAYFTSILMGDYIASKIGPNYTIKLAPEISPNKTVGGAIANLITSCLICVSLKFFIDFSIVKCLFLGTIISIFAQFGDLAISSLKRDLNIKHSGSFFMEYGGLLDRMDSFIFSAPATYYCLILFS